MLRNLVAALLVLVTCAGTALADEVGGKLVKADADKGTITVALLALPGGSIMPDKDFTLSKDTKIFDFRGNEIKEGLKAKFFEKAGGMLLITTEKKPDGKVVVTKVKAAVEQPK